jgi:hypothetical protein
MRPVWARRPVAKMHAKSVNCMQSRSVLATKLRELKFNFQNGGKFLFFQSTFLKINKVYSIISLTGRYIILCVGPFKLKRKFLWANFPEILCRTTNTTPLHAGRDHATPPPPHIALNNSHQLDPNQT